MTDRTLCYGCNHITSYFTKRKNLILFCVRFDCAVGYIMRDGAICHPKPISFGSCFILKEKIKYKKKGNIFKQIFAYIFRRKEEKKWLMEDEPLSKYLLSTINIGNLWLPPKWGHFSLNNVWQWFHFMIKTKNLI